MQCPSHGYRIKKLFAPFVSKNGLNDGQVYPILSRLEKAQLVRKEIVHQQKSPSKNIYHITDRGREEFMSWLMGSADETDPIKYDLFRENRLYVACQPDDDLPYVLNYTGEDNVVLGTDYGHSDSSTELEAMRTMREECPVPRDTVEKILDANPRALYGL